MAPFFAPGGASEILPRYSFIEPLLAGRRVLEVGAAGATGGRSAIFLAERGAAAVLSVDAPEAVEQAAAASHHPFVQFRSGALAELPAGAFDLAIVTDGAALAADPARVAELKALLAPDGILVAAVPAPGGAGLLALAGTRPPLADEVPAYESFAGALSAEFEAVEVATQSAMLGYVLAPAQVADDPGITVDGALAGPAEAAYYLAICGAEPSRLEGLTLVALPARPLADAAAASGEAARAHAQCVDATALESEAAELRRILAEREEALAAKDGEIAEALARVAERDGLIAAKDAALLDLEVAAEAARVQGQGVAADLEREREARFEVQAALDRAQAAAREAEAERGALRERSRELEAESTARLESEASSQAARAEAQAARAAVQSALARAEEGEARAAELEQALEDARRREGEIRGEIEAGLAAREVRSAELEMRAAELEAGAAELRAELARSREELEASGLERDAERARADGGEAERESLRSEVAGVRAALEAAEARSREAAGESARRLEAEAQAREELERARAELEGKTRALAQLESQAAGARAAAEESEAQAAALEAELLAVRWDKDEIEQKLTARGAGEAGEPPPDPALQARLREAEAQLADRETRLAKLQRELADKTERLGRLAKEVGELKSKEVAERFSR